MPTYFVTGASGFVGSAIVKELIDAGHKVIGLARSDKSAATIISLGAQVIRGDLSNIEVLKKAASEFDEIAHFGFIHDFANFEASCMTDREAILAMCSVLEGSNKPFVAAFGTLSLPNDHIANEQNKQALEGFGSHRGKTEELFLDQAKKGINTMALRLSPTVHGKGDGAFIPMIIASARKNGKSAYVDAGNTRWSAVHRLDAAHLVRLALEKPKAGIALHAGGEEGVIFKDIATIIGKKLNLPVESIPSGEAAFAHFGFLGGLVGVDNPVSSEATQKSFGWKAQQPDLLTDLQGDYYYHPDAVPRF